MKLNDRINIIVAEKDGFPDSDPIVFESDACSSAGEAEDRARKLAYSGRYGKVYVGSISSNCLTEITTHGGAVTNSAGVRFKAKPVVEEIELSDVALERLTGDILDDFLCADEFLMALKAKAHAKEVAQAEKVEKYKRDLLDSREARFYARFREFGATHEEAAKLAWGDQ